MGRSVKRSSVPNDCASLSEGVGCKAGGKPHSECLRGDVQLCLWPSEKAARRQKRRLR